MIVVDTEAVIWLAQDPSRLSRAAAEAIVEGRWKGTLAIADITLREIASTIAMGRVTVVGTLGEYLRFVESVFTVLPVTSEIAQRSVVFGLAYPKDPADQLIGATAIVHAARLVTKDEKIRSSGEVNCVW